jgi:nucleotide-binding universal stress UspA family protein
MSLRRLSIANVLCPTDFSGPADNALERAVTIAEWFHAKLTVMHAIPYAPEPHRASVDGGEARAARPLVQSRTEVEHDLKKAIARNTDRLSRVEWEIAEGEPWRAIECRAASLPADLVVMGNQGRSGWDRLLIGSTTEKVTRHLRCPILAVGAAGAPRKGMLFRRILCALDLTDNSKETIDLAFALAEENLAEVTLLHVLDGRKIPWEPAPRTNTSRSALQEAAEDGAKQEMRTLAERCWTFCRTDAVVANGTPWREVLRIADEVEADLIVTGAHAPASAGTSFLGSTADQLLRHASCPVLLAKPHSHRGSDLTASEAPPVAATQS